MFKNCLILNILFISYYLSIILAANPPYGKLSVRNGQLKGSNDQVATLRGISLWFSQWITEFYSPGVVRAIKCFYNGNVVSLFLRLSFVKY